MENKISLFGYEWETTLINDEQSIKTWEFKNQILGKFFTTDIDELICSNTDFYKIISVIHEKSVLGVPYFITTDKNIEKLKEINSIYSNGNYSLCTINTCILDFPEQLSEKQIHTLLLLYKLFPEVGFEIPYYKMQPFHFFSKDKDGFIYVAEAMNNLNLIKAVFAIDDSDDFDIFASLQIGENGWKIIESLNKPNNSNQCFIAMWFDECMVAARNKIKTAIGETGYTPFLIDEKHFNNFITVELLEEIKKSRFLIADLSGDRGGVYLEAGFAMGLNLPVIFSCEANDFSKVHFDIKQYNMIIWNNEDELYEKLKDRIRETIK